MDVLNTQRPEGDAKHPCPMPLPLYRRIIGLWACKGDLVGEPFSGHGSGGCVAIEQGVEWEGCELKPEFFDDQVKNLRGYETRHLRQTKLI